MYAFLHRTSALPRITTNVRVSISRRSARHPFLPPQRKHCATKASAAPPNVAIIGAGGNMATALINGLMSQSTPPVIYASSPSLHLLSHLPEAAKQNQTTSNTEACRQANLVLLCVKPNIAPIVLSEIAPTLHQSENDPVLVSIVAGISTSSLQQHMSLSNQSRSPIPIVRAMPNLPASTRSACTVICTNEAAQQHHISRAEQILTAVGTVYHASEALMSSASGLSGAGVAYVFMMAEALADAGVKHGFSREHAMAMAADTIKGAGDMLQQKTHPALLRNKVESPGGVTAAGTSQLEQRGFRAAIGAAVDAAVNKAQQMGDN
ncbi:pyrroline-5-carboxylate reductase [Gracilaria domingensis]|nr:pyrroline-5-carboxylate reductase [Gracilaria domingensis]